MTDEEILKMYSYFPHKEVSPHVVDKFRQVYANLVANYPNMKEQDRRYNLALRMQAYDSNLHNQ